MKRNQTIVFCCLFVILLIANFALWTDSPVEAQSGGQVKTLQVTIGAAVTQASTSNIFCREIIFQNNAGHTMRVGDVNTTATRGALLASGAPGTSATFGPFFSPTLDLSTFYVAGTNGDLVDVIYVQ